MEHYGFVKIKLSIIERVKEIITSIEWLSLTVIPICGFNGKWYEDEFTFMDRWECFLSCMDTVIRGYVWGLKEQ